MASNILQQATSLPSQVGYGAVKPMGFPSQIKQLVIDPMSQYGPTIANQDIIRFQINSEGYWDPYSCQFNIEVQFFPLGNETAILQLDGSAHSLIETMSIQCKGVELERIDQYDQVATLLQDMQYGLDTRPSRIQEGVGYGQFRNIPLPTMESIYTNKTQSEGATNTTIGKANLLSAVNQDEFLMVYGGSQPADTGDFNIKTDVTGMGLFFQGNGFSTQARSLTNQPKLSEVTSKFPFERIDQKIIHSDFTYSPSLISKQPMDHLTNGSYAGALSNSFTNAAWEPRYSRFCQQKIIYNGLIDNPQAITHANYRIPVISGLLGVLMPPESYRFVPMKTLQNTSMELRLNRYAFFTSGMEDGQQMYSPDGLSYLQSPLFSNNSTGIQNSLGWKITKFQIIVDIIDFDIAMKQILNQTLKDGIYLHSTGWMLGYFQVFSKTQDCKGSFNINVGLESLKMAAITYNSNDYLTYNFCRKKYRYSRNLKSLQLKIGLENFPQNALKGHGGNGLAPTISDQNNLEFVMETYKSFGKLHSIGSNAFINPANFAINMRPYNPSQPVSATLKYLAEDASGIVSMPAPLQRNIVQGWPLFYENQVIGKALYCINCESMNNSTYISGVSTIVSRPFQLEVDVWPVMGYQPYQPPNFGVNPQVPASGDKYHVQKNMSEVSNDNSSTMYVFLYYDVLFKLAIGQVEVIGKGGM